MGNKKKTVFNVVFLGLLIIGTLYAILRGQDLGLILAQLKSANYTLLFVGVILVVIYVCSESIIIYYLLRVVHVKWPLYRCIRYSFIGFFFSCITPFASGGQPAQLYYMKKEGLSIAPSTIVLLLVTIEYKFVLVFIGVGIVLFGQGLLLAMPAFARGCFYLGIILNIIVIAAMALMILAPSIPQKILTKCISLLGRIHILKHPDDKLSRIDSLMERYRAASQFLKQNHFAIWNAFLLSLFQRIALFFITFIVYCSLGFHGHGPVEITILQSSISISVDMLPLPGGMGISEALFRQIFYPIFGNSEAMTTSAMLISRGISYYALLIISAVITIYSHMVIGKTKKGRKK